MAETINPAVSGSRTRASTEAAAFVAGTAAGAACALALVLTLAAVVLSVAGSGTLLALSVCATAWVVLAELGLPLPVPYRKAQVPEWLRDFLPRPAVAGTFGLMLGFGFMTYLTTSTQFVLLVLLALMIAVDVLPLVLALAVLLVFACAKAIVITPALLRHEVEQAAIFHWTPLRARVLRASGAYVSLLAVTSVTSALH